MLHVYKKVITVLLLLVYCLFLTSGCKKTHVSGMYVDLQSCETLKNDINSGKKVTASEVINTIGAPSLHEDPNTWYYIATTVERYKIQSPNIVRQQIVKAVFNNQDQLTHIFYDEWLRNTKLVFAKSVVGTYEKSTNIISKYISILLKNSYKKKVYVPQT